MANFEFIADDGSINEVDVKRNARAANTPDDVELEPWAHDRLVE